MRQKPMSIVVLASRNDYREMCFRDALVLYMCMPCVCWSREWKEAWSDGLMAARVPTGTSQKRDTSLPGSPGRKA